MTTLAFSTLPLTPAVLTNLTSLGYEYMTPVQEQSLPHVLEGRDVIAKAKTGSGKTVAFSLGILHRLKPELFRLQAVVLCPTRELADQVSKEIRRLARAVPNVKVLTLCGGMPMGPQIGSLEHGAHIIVATPGRLLDHMSKGRLAFEHVNTLVLDEADRMLDMGFRDAIEEVAEAIPRERQTLLFSATYPDEIKAMSAGFQQSPVSVSVEAVQQSLQIEQVFYTVEKNARFAGLERVLAYYQPQSAVIFCSTKVQTDEVANELKDRDYFALAIHGDMEQKDRDQVLLRFANKSCSILVATDVAARGLDIKDIELVVNYELTRDPEVHVHRIGRTGRAGKDGRAVSLYTESEHYKRTAIEDYLQQSVVSKPVTELDAEFFTPDAPPMVTIQIDGGKKDKLRPGDILGALTGDGGMHGSQIGKIDVLPMSTYIAIERESVNQALKAIQQGKIKGRQFKVRKLR